MVKAKTAIVIVILALLQVSCKTAGSNRYNVVTMMVNGRGTAVCNARFHSDDDLIVALPSKWYVGGKRCHKTIRITSIDTGRTVEAQVVDKCECGFHSCKNNKMHSSPAVWKKLGLHSDVGKVHIICSDS